MEDELDLEYADEFELMAELEDDGVPVPENDIQKIKKTLDFNVTDSMSSQTSSKDASNTCKKPKKLGFTESLMESMCIDAKKLNKDGAQNGRGCTNGFKEQSAVVGNSSFYRKQKRSQRKSLSGEDEDNEGSHKRQKLEHEKVHRKVPSTGDFISITHPHGDRAYLPFKASSDHKSFSNLSTSKACKSLLLTAISDLKLELESKKNKQSLEDSSSVDNGFQGADDDDGQCKDGADDDSARVTSELWVDKYTPKSYIELISAESMNKTLLRWLKLWDCCCFGVQHKQQQNQQNTEDFFNKNKKLENKINDKNKSYNDNTNSNSKNTSYGNNNNNKSNYNNNKFNNYNKIQLLYDENDTHKRPLLKVALVSGPPGLGKTTLVHVVAKQAGYNVVEMNASDDRSAELFRNKLEAATQMRSVLPGATQRPNCLVVDEIDGAPQAMIEVLVGMLKKLDGGEGGGATRKKKKRMELLRPVICICNDVYVPALRSLRPHALLVPFQAPFLSALTNRLLKISQAERLQTSSAALMALCEKNHNDVRSCVNTLQFVKRKFDGELTLSRVASLPCKDHHNSLIPLLQHLFSIPTSRKSKLSNPHDSTTYFSESTTNHLHNNSTDQQRFQTTLTMLSSSGDEGRVVEGLFDNYLLCNLKDPRMNLMSESADWLCFSDQLDHFIATNQNYAFMKYLPFTPVSLHFLLATNRPHKLQWPKSQVENHQATKRNRELLHSLLAGCHLSIKRFSVDSSYHMQTLPYLLHAINPVLRPVNQQLFSSQEKESVRRVVMMMILHNLSYKQERNPDGVFIFNLQPNVEELVWWSDVCKSHKRLSYSCQQTISREIELERMRRREGTLESREVQKADRQVTKPKAAFVEDKVKMAVDFFGRTINKTLSQKTKDDEATKAASSEAVFGVVWYRYKEGFTNAVKRSVRVKDLF